MSTRSLALLVLWLALVAAPPAAAQETGTVACTVVDRAGAPVAGAGVRITGDQLPSARTTMTSENGLITAVLSPGSYTVEVNKPGIGTRSQPVTVELNRETPCALVLGAITADPVSVTAPIPPAVDLRSTEIVSTFRRALVQDLPLDRSYLGLMQLIPGIAQNNASAPNGGGSQHDNTFLLDSVNITNPFVGYLATEVNELDIVQFDVKRGAIRAESGRSIGLVTNALLKSGTNVFRGDYRFEALASRWVAASTKTVRSRTNRKTHAFDVGGPVVKNLLFYYGSANIVRSESPDAVNIFGPLPSRVEETNEVFGKATARFGSRHVVNVSMRYRPTTVDFAGIGAYDAPSVASNVRGRNRVTHVRDDWFAGDRTTVSLRFTRVDERGESSAVRDLGFQPTFHEDSLESLGHLVTGGLGLGGASLKFSRQDYRRHEVKASVSQLFNGGSMTHQVKAGFGFDEGVEDLTRQSNGWGEIGSVLFGGELRIRGTYYPAQPAQRSTGRTYSLYVQDDIRMGPRLTVNAGVLLNRDAFDQSSSDSDSTSFPAFGFLDEIQPRLGFSAQVRKAVGDKAYVHWGRYIGLDQKGSARGVAAGRLYTMDVDFDPLRETIVSHVISPNTGTKTIAASLEPPRTHELVAGYAAPLGGPWTFEAFFIDRYSDHFIEDAPVLLPYANFQFQNDPFAERSFRTVTVDLRRRLQNDWSVDVSYGWSRLSGNFDLDYAGDFTAAAVVQTSSLTDDGPGAFTSDQFRYGLLSQDRTHVYKILATWVPKPLDGVSVGLFARGQSGTPWEARGLPWNSGITYLRLLEPAGSHRTPFWTNVDLLLKYALPLRTKSTLRVEGRVLNLFNAETTLLVDQRQYLDPRNLTIAGTPAAGCWSCFTDAFQQGTLQPNSRFGQPVAYAPPRRFILSVAIDF